MWYRKIKYVLMLTVIGWGLLGCVAMQTELGKQSLDVQTRMTRTVFLEPVSTNQKTVFIDIKNTSGKDVFDLQSRLQQAIVKKGYMVQSDPNKAHYLIQANVLQLSKCNANEVNSAFDSGFGGGLLGAAIAGATGGNQRALIGATLAGAVVGLAADAMVKDIYYTIITDVRVGERDGLKAWRKQQTRIISTANKANLQLAEATPLLVDELVKAIAGVV